MVVFQKRYFLALLTKKALRCHEQPVPRMQALNTISLSKRNHSSLEEWPIPGQDGRQATKDERIGDKGHQEGQDGALGLPLDEDGIV